MAYLVLVRHGKSEWNEKGLWTGWTDVSLAPEGIEEAKKTGELLKDIHFDAAFTSALKRTQETLAEIKQVIGQTDLIAPASIALNERNYGTMTGKNKWEIKEQYGDEQFTKWRRGWDEPIPEGETLKDVYARVVPYFQSNILPLLLEGKNVLVVASGNSLRALVKFLENISDEEIATVEITTGECYVYQIDETGKAIDKEVKGMNPNKV